MPAGPAGCAVIPATVPAPADNPTLTGQACQHTQSRQQPKDAPQVPSPLPALGSLLGVRTLAAVTIANAIHLASAQDLFAEAREVLRPGGGIAVIANGTPLWQQPVPWSRAVRHGLEQWLGTRLESCCGTDAQSRQRYESELLAAGFNGVHEQSLDYTGHLSFDELIGGLYSAMPSHLLPPPSAH